MKRRWAPLDALKSATIQFTFTFCKIRFGLNFHRLSCNADHLKLNDSKTEFFITGSAYNLRHLPPAEIMMGSAEIKPSQSICNLGVMLNPTLSLSNHVDMLRRSINFHVRNLWRIRRYIDQNTCHHVARALITSRLDYYSAMFTVLSLSRLNVVQKETIWSLILYVVCT